MTVSSADKGKFYSGICSEIVRSVAKVIGNTAYTLAGTVGGVTVGKDQSISISGTFEKKNLDELVSVYSRIIGPVARTLAIHAAEGKCGGFEELVPEDLLLKEAS